MNLYRVFSTVFVGILLIGCSAISSVSSSKYFEDIIRTDDQDYGYTPEKPIKMRNGSQPATMRTMYDFIGALKSENGNHLEMITRYSVENPNYEGRATNPATTKDPTPMLDKILVVPKGEQDTLALYFNTFIPEEVKIPKGLELDSSRF
ncbi:MAG: hypothetical protein ABR572_11435 [Cryomorphaceae bacterium]|nr:hypothetical protein [Flavobacteriales bacterium]